MACIRKRLISVRKLHRVEVLALDVLDDRKFEPIGRRHIENDGRQRLSARKLAGTESTLAHDELESIPRLAHDHRLQHTMLADRTCQLCKTQRVELSARLVWVRID
jgi:hypothetical protein